MKPRTLAFVAVAASIAGVIIWRRRRRSLAALSRVRLGFADGSSMAPDPSDLLDSEVLEAAAAVRAAVETRA
jgi:hypothetical protein